jgi:inhibitor of the pro-sigma K processing machinery
MNGSIGAFIIIGICGLVLLMGAFKAKMEWIINFILRCVAGALAIYFINLFMGSQSIDAQIGINATNVLTSGFLGFPGLILLYGINFYRFL